MVLCVWFILVVNISASDCLERLVPEMIYYVSRGTLNSTRSLILPTPLLVSGTTCLRRRVQSAGRVLWLVLFGQLLKHVPLRNGTARIGQHVTPVSQLRPGRVAAKDDTTDRI